MNIRVEFEWWEPTDRPAWSILDENGNVEYGPLLGKDEVICDVCGVDVNIRPVPVVAGNALCSDCFQDVVGIPIREAAQQAGVMLEIICENLKLDCKEEE